jgi:hypothetical protein
VRLDRRSDFRRSRIEQDLRLEIEIDQRFRDKLRVVPGVLDLGEVLIGADA